MSGAGDPSEPDPPDPDLSDADLSRRNVRLGAVVLAVLVGLVGISLVRGARSGGAPSLSGALRDSLERDGCTVDSRADPGRRHISGARYAVNPPAGGDHDPVPSPAGFYVPGNVPADGHLVHSLEHGFVVVWYQPDAVAPTTLEALRALADRAAWVLVVPRPSMPTALAATSWHRRLLCPDGALAPIGTFARIFRDKAPEKGFAVILGGFRRLPPGCCWRLPPPLSGGHPPSPGRGLLRSGGLRPPPAVSGERR